MNNKIWASKITVENLNYAIAQHEFRGRYEAGEALRKLFPFDVDEEYIKNKKHQWQEIEIEDQLIKQ